MEVHKTIINLKKQSQVGKTAKSIGDNPLVAIRCITYNHEPYIRDALEGFVMQKTNFPFVAIVHDDASTDGTTAIIREYASKYPDIIKPIYEIENQYSKRDGSLTRIMNKACEETGAMYIAFCEGDDYWIDPLKLQKQVDFLETNKSYSMVHSDFYIYVQDKNEMNEYHVLDSAQASPESVLLFYRIQTVTVMTRTDMLLQIMNSDDFLFKNGNFLMGDVPLFFLLSLRGHIGVISTMTAVYRVILNSASHKINTKEKKRFALSSMELRMYFAQKFHLSNDFYVKISRRYNRILLSYLFCDIAYIPMFPFKNWGILGRLLNWCKKSRSNGFM